MSWFIKLLSSILLFSLFCTYDTLSLRRRRQKSVSASGRERQQEELQEGSGSVEEIEPGEEKSELSVADILPQMVKQRTVIEELKEKLKPFKERAEKGKTVKGAFVGEEKVPINEKLLKDLKDKFERAKTDARKLGPYHPKLIKIVPWNKKDDLVWSQGNRYVLMVSWMPLGIMRDFYLSDLRGRQTTGNRLMWVTAVPELKKFMRKYRKKESKSSVPMHYRLNQLLGLDPGEVAKYFVEVWVKPEDLMRPCLDPEVIDADCIFDPELIAADKLGEPYDDIFRLVSVPEAHQQWFEKERKENTYPWTRLGFSYDWGDTTGKHVGVSEFAIKPGSSVYVQRVVTTDGYLDSSDIKSGTFRVPGT